MLHRINYQKGPTSNGGRAGTATLRCIKRYIAIASAMRQVYAKNGRFSNNHSIKNMTLILHVGPLIITFTSVYSYFHLLHMYALILEIGKT